LSGIQEGQGVPFGGSGGGGLTVQGLFIFISAIISSML
jgi:hypothetical protein